MSKPNATISTRKVKPGDRLLSPADASKALGMSKAWLVDHVVGRLLPVLPCYVFGNRMKVHEQDLLDFINEMAAASATAEQDKEQTA